MTHAPAAVAAAAGLARSDEATAFSGCQLRPSPQAAKQARAFTRHALVSWGLAELCDDAEVVVGELLANAVRHALGGPAGHAYGGWIGLWLLRHEDGCMCVVTDPSDATPAMRSPAAAAENGRGLHVIHSLSDHWGWSLLARHGKAVWAILYRS